MLLLLQFIVVIAAAADVVELTAPGTAAARCNDAVADAQCDDGADLAGADTARACAVEGVESELA